MCRKELKRAMLGQTVEIEAVGAMSFDEARRIAQSEARKRGVDPMLMAWFDRDTGKYSPQVE
jgi:hypothetical protein